MADYKAGGTLEIPDDELAVALRGHFYAARMHGKCLTKARAAAEERVAPLKKSLEKYEWLKAFARERIAALPKVPRPKTLLEDPVWVDPAGVFKDELDMVDQMCELLPQQIARVHYSNQDLRY